MKPVYSLIVTALLYTSASTAFASTNCDCSTLIAQCGAAISTTGSDIQIMTNTKRCSKVTWYANEEAHSTIVNNGKNNETSSFKSKPFLSIGSCEICANTHPISATGNNRSEESAECKKRKTNLKMSEKFYTAGRITPYEYQLSKDMVKKHCN